MPFRLILHSDSENPLLKTAEKFGKALQEFKPQLFVVSGLMMMDNFPFSEGDYIMEFC